MDVVVAAPVPLLPPVAGAERAREVEGGVVPLCCAIDGGGDRRRPSQFPRQISPSSASSSVRVRPFDQETSTALISFRRDSKEERGREGEMNRGDMEGLLSHYHPNCGDGGTGE